MGLLLLFFSSINLTAQVTQEWVQRYNGPGDWNDWGYSLALDGAGNIYVTGYSWGGSNTFYDYATIKYNPAGQQQWVARYNYSANYNDVAYWVVVDGSANVYVTGYGTLSGTTNRDFVTIKYNTAGIQQWVAAFNGPSNGEDWAFMDAVDSSGNVYAGGYTKKSSSDYDYVTVKYNSAGVQQWVQYYDGTANGFDEVRSMGVDPTGNVYVTGYSQQTGTGYDMVTIKYNTAGVQQWLQKYNSTGGNDFAWGLAVDPSGNVYITGEGPGVAGTDFITIKYNTSGVQQWVSTYNGSGNDADYGRCITFDGSGNVYATGAGIQTGTNYDYVTIKYNSSGAQQWASTYNGPGNGIDYPYGLAIDNSGNVYVSGLSTGSGTFWDYATAKYNSSGVQQWAQRYDGPVSGDDGVYGMGVDNSGNVYVTGWSAGAAGNIKDYATVKYSQTVGIKPISSEIPGEYNLHQNYPNPFNPVTKIEFSLPLPSEGGVQDIKLAIFDVLGREISTLVNEQLNPGKYEVEWDASNYPSGVYYYKLMASDFTESKKMVLVK